MDLLFNVLFAVVGLSVLVIAHETGHYVVARAFKMRVLRYSIGFGPALFRYKPKGSPTTFQVCILPFLAYVEIAGMNPQEEVDDDDPDVFHKKSLFGRIATVLAGPAANYLTAVVLIFALALIGWPGAEREPMVIKEVAEGSPAQAAGLLPGDLILAANDEDIRSTADLMDKLEDRAESSTTIRFVRDDKDQTISVVPASRVELYGLGFALSSYPNPGATISDVAEDTPAEEVGLKENDVIVKAGDQAVANTAEFASLCEEHGIPRTFTVQRGGETLDFVFSDDYADRRFRAKKMTVRGVVGVVGTTEPMLLGDAAKFAVLFPIEMSVFAITELVTNFDFDSFAGPVKLGKVIADTAELGILPYIRTLAMLSVAIGFFNLLPFPGLDGGRLSFLAYEGITRRPAHTMVEAWVHLVGLLFLLSIVLIVTFRDIQELFG